MSKKVAPLRIVTANVQSFPESALTLDEALEDLIRNAEIGDVVLLQEIAERYRPLVRQAFPADQWFVYFGPEDNASPIAARRNLFTKVDASAADLHPPVADRNRRRYTTHLHLRHRALGRDLHVVNAHFVPGAFNNTKLPDKADRVREWNDGIARHCALVASLVETGDPVVGGGDYNRQLKRYRPLGAEIAGRPVRYAVPPESIDMLWFIGGTDTRWRIGEQTTFGGRDDRLPQRNSDHGARRAIVVLRAGASRPEEPEKPEEPTMPKAQVHKPFDRTTYGDVRPKTVDWKTVAALEEAERRLGYRLTIVQGSYNAGGVRQSAGTHDGGGVVDLLPWDWQHKVRVLRDIGFAAWYRPTLSGQWNAHIHAVLIDHGRLSPSAAAQVVSYRAGRDGLKGNRADTFYRPNPIPVFAYTPTKPSKPKPSKPKPGKPKPGKPKPGADPTTPEAKPVAPEGPTGRGFQPWPPPLSGVDTSHYQGGKIDLKLARSAGVQWWYVKATEGTTFVDPTYAKRVRQARRAGLPVGAYHFARPDNGDADDEAKFFLATADIRAGDMLPMLDLESSEGLNPSELTAWTGTWVRIVTRHLAKRGLAGRPIIYTPFNLENGFGCYCWVARYNNAKCQPVVPRPWKTAAIWQHSNGRYGPVKHVPGFGAVDVNALHPGVSLAALRVRPAGPPKPTPSPTPPPVVTPTPADPGRTDMQEIRRALVTAARAIEAAVDRLPER